MLRVSEEVAAALDEARPLVALESTLISHGLPYPRNLEVARQLEDEVRAAGAVPATIGVVAGAPTIGLGPAELERFATAGEAVRKLTRRDIAVAAAQGADGATTVAATMAIAAAAGLSIFATGGIGGVHPAGGGHGLDVSADLAELARQPVAVISSGAKSILDLAATYEALDALGVPVIGFGTDEFPAFHSAASGIRLKHRMDDPAVLARAVRLHWSFPGAGGVLICHPPPAGAALSRDELTGLVDAALGRAAAAGIVGDAVTPYVLAALNELSGGRTLRANHALAVANAGLGARLAGALC